jgi:S1-C subfamily serine protease
MKVNLLTESEYPWTQPEGRELYRFLVTLYPSPRRALPVAERAGVKLWDIQLEQPASSLWADILNYCAPRDGLLTALVEQAVADTPSDFLRALLADETPPVAAEPLSGRGAPQFVHNDDTITEPEALLFHDDLSLPIGRLPTLIATLGKLVELAPSVCKLTVRAGGTEQYGTGFRVGADTLMTNWHVVHSKADRSPATMIAAEFGFEDDAAGRPVAATVISCDAAIVASSQQDDWAVIRTLDPLQADWPAIELANDAEPDRDDSAFIIQHPMGMRKRVGFVRNQISYVDDRVVHYLTDTDVGSSGSPVVDAEGRIIALHHAGGRPLQEIGEPPMRKNEGIRISRVVEGMRDA